MITHSLEETIKRYMNLNACYSALLDIAGCVVKGGPEIAQK